MLLQSLPSNNMLLPGPKLLTDVCDVILNFRFRRVVFACDIKQMHFTQYKSTSTTIIKNISLFTGMMAQQSI